MDRFTELQNRIQEMHQGIIRLLSESDSLSKMDRNMLGASAQKAFELGLELSRAIHSRDADRKGLVSRVLHFVGECISVIIRLT